MPQTSNRPLAAILNSRQSKTPLGTDAWITRTLEAVEYAVRKLNADVVSSIGMVTWDLVTWKAAQCGAHLQLVLPKREEEADRLSCTVCREFELTPDRLAIDLLPVEMRGHSRKSWWAARDRRVVERADVLIPVAVRPGGELEQLLVQATGRKTIERRLTTRYAPVAHHERMAIDPARLSAESNHWSPDFLIHWTRARHGAWPGEKTRDFCRDLAGSRQRYCRGARETLMRILSERLLRASSWHIGDNRPMVAFTELTPVESVPLMRWRSRWARWSFEPYGVAIRRPAAEQYGARPVRYVSSADWASLPSPDKPFCHASGKDGSDWPAEREWRVQGDLDLRNVSHDDLIVLVRDPDDVAVIRQVWPGPIVAMTRE